ncbi:MAG: sugar dehydrogenase [Acidimicrobiaceae bacterium]|nr:sugar dehydrogenase [Acidimicrobiaceae bacterium]MYI36410.1 sugar dehydrogenase [Acidimicrobiaceae bacterium]
MKIGLRMRRLGGMLAAGAVVAVSAVGGGCAADDELSTPRPTVPTVKPVPERAQPADGNAEADQTADAERTGDEQPDRDTPAGAAAANDEPAGPADAEWTTASEGQADASETGGTTSADPGQGGVTVRPDGDMFAADVALQAVLTLDEPIDMAVAPGDDLVWIAERAGRVSRVDLERGAVVETILDIGAETEATGERGLLGIAVTDRWLYANFTDLAGNTRVDAFERDGTGLGGHRRTILFQTQPFSNHNGGDLAIGPDGFLYVAFGDGGSGGDPLNAGQDPTTWLGAVLRIEPTPDAAEPYAVPTDNPFAAGQDGAGRPEIFLTGVRNPWRLSFDRATGDLWIADVGQDAYEEVTVLLAANGGGLGANLGWRLREGLHRFTGDEPPNHADPVWEYSQDDGCSVTGGYVYRGSAIEDLYGAYVFGDYCTSRLWALQISTGEVEFRELGAEVFGGSLASFGEDALGELYVLSLNGTVARIVPR